MGIHLAVSLLLSVYIWLENARRCIFCLKKISRFVGRFFYVFCCYEVIQSIIQNIILTTIQASPINKSHNATCLSIVRHLLYLSSFPAAVNIRNHAYKRIISAINANIHSTRFIAPCIISIMSTSLAAWVASVVPGSTTHVTPVTPHHCAMVNALSSIHHQSIIACFIFCMGTF